MLPLLSAIAASDPSRLKAYASTRVPPGAASVATRFPVALFLTRTTLSEVSVHKGFVYFPLRGKGFAGAAVPLRVSTTAIELSAARGAGLVGYSSADYDTFTRLGWLRTPQSRVPDVEAAELVPARADFLPEDHDLAAVRADNRVTAVVPVVRIGDGQQELAG